MIAKIILNKNIRKLFKKGEVFELHPLTVLVGDNGSGKSTFLRTLVDYIEHPKDKIFDRENSGSKLDSYMFMDFERDNPRTKNDNNAGVFSVFSNFRSHGETNMDLICNHFSEFENKLVLLDEPDQALSIRSIIRFKKVIDQMLKQGCQIIMAVHSETMVRLAGIVYSIEHHKWMTAEDFLKSQNEPKKIRTVDSFEENKYYVIKLINDENYAEYLSSILSQYSSQHLAYAKRYKSRKIAENAAKRELEKNDKEYKRKHGLEKEFFKRFVSYEIEEYEEMFPEE